MDINNTNNYSEEIEVLDQTEDTNDEPLEEDTSIHDAEEEERKEEELQEWMLELLMIEREGYDTGEYASTGRRVKIKRTEEWVETAGYDVAHWKRTGKLIDYVPAPSRPYGWVYKITNKKTGHVYIGKTTLSVCQRWQEHARAAESGRGSRFHREIRATGIDAFTFETIATANDAKELDRTERRWIAAHRAADPDSGYNTQGGGSC